MKKLTITMLLVFMSFIFTFGNTQFANTNKPAIIESPQLVNNNCSSSNSISGTEVNLYVDRYNYSIGSEIGLAIYTTLESDISNITFTSEGFVLTEDFLILSDRIDFSITHISSTLDPFISINIFLEDGRCLSQKLTGIVRDNQLFIAPHDYYFAEEVYKYYIESGNETLMALTVEEMETINSTAEETSPVLLSDSEFDTTVSGRVLWRETDVKNDDGTLTEGTVHPLVYCKVQLWDKNLLSNDLLIAETYTDENGCYTFSFVNNTSTTENGYDIYVKVVAKGTDITVINLIGQVYSETIPNSYISDINSDVYTIPDVIYDSGTYDLPNWFGRALNVTQASIYASTYYEELKMQDVANAIIYYPHGLVGTGCRYIREIKTVCIVLFSSLNDEIKSYESWDVIMHEYGHHVAYEENIVDSPEWGHDGSAMAEHFRSHLDGGDCNIFCAQTLTLNSISEEECKYAGNALSWGEAWPSLFAEMVKKHYSLEGFNNLEYGEYKSYNGLKFSLESKYYNINSEDSEFAVLGILYDMFDTNNETNDNISLDSNYMWEITTSSQAKTFYEFSKYFIESTTNRDLRSSFGSLLKSYCFAPGAPQVCDENAYNLTSYCPTYKFTWNEPENIIYYNDRTFQLRFYDLSMNLIAITEPKIVDIENGTGTITVDEAVWTKVLNSTTEFYISAAMHENNTPATSYEGPLSYNKIRDFVDAVSISCEYSRNIQADQYYWIKFIAPYDSEFVFQTIGTTDTYGEIFSGLAAGDSIINRIVCDDNSGTDNNFQITYTLSKDEVIYLRISSANGVDTGDFTLDLSHIHSYTHSYEHYTKYKHTAYCYCGAYTTEYHDNIELLNGRLRCKLCGYVTIGPTPIIKNTISADITNNANYVYYNKEDED